MMVLNDDMLRIWQDHLLGCVCLRAIGIQVDFTQKPFKVIGLNIEAWGARVKTLLKR